MGGGQLYPNFLGFVDFFIFTRSLGYKEINNSCESAEHGCLE